jgi:hypothetical protein
MLPSLKRYYLFTLNVRNVHLLLLTGFSLGKGSTNLHPHPGSLASISLLRSFFRNSLSIMSGLSNATTSTTNYNTYNTISYYLSIRCHIIYQLDRLKILVLKLPTLKRMLTPEACFSYWYVLLATLVMPLERRVGRDGHEFTKFGSCHHPTVTT